MQKPLSRFQPKETRSWNVQNLSHLILFLLPFFLSLLSYFFLSLSLMFPSLSLSLSLHIWYSSKIFATCNCTRWWMKSWKGDELTWQILRETLPTQPPKKILKTIFLLPADQILCHPLFWMYTLCNNTTQSCNTYLADRLSENGDSMKSALDHTKISEMIRESVYMSVS